MASYSIIRTSLESTGGTNRLEMEGLQANVLLITFVEKKVILFIIIIVYYFYDTICPEPTK